MTGGNRNRLWGGPPLSRDVRSAIAEQAVRWVLVPALLVGAFAALMVFATVGLSEPTRFVPLLVFAAPCLWIYRLKRARRWLAAAAVLSGAVTLTVVTAVLLNSVHAPAYWLGLMVLSLIVPLFGMRWGIATALLLLAAGACWLALDAAELTTGVRYAAATTTYGLYAGFLLIALCLLSGPHLLVADALNEAQRKRKEAEAARIAEAASELAFHAVFDQASVAMVLLTSKGTVAQLNHRALSLLGSSGHPLVGRELSTAPLWTEPQRRLLADAVERAAAGKRSQQELTLPSNDSGQHVFHLTVSPYHTAQGTVEHVIAELVDVTDLIDTRSMLASARRLEALGKLSGGVAHDINNMLGAILSGSELVLLGLKRGDTVKVAENAALIQASVLRAASLTKQLLAFGRKDRWNSERLDVNRLVGEMVLLLGRTLHKNIDVVVLPADLGCCVRADAAALEHALLNLALNAQDSMPDGGTLTIRCSRTIVDDTAAAALSDQFAPGPAVVVTVADRGSGMTDEVRERMFEPFFTTKALGKGSGLGLAAVHGTIRSHGGAIAVSTCVGVGTSVDLYLPALEPQLSELQNQPSSALTISFAPLRARVLLADDETFVRNATAAMLESLGCEVQSVGDGSALIDALAEGANPDLIVSDLAMPGLGGARLVQTLEAIRPTGPLILITGFSGDDVSKTCPPRSNRRLLRKPFMRAELQQTVHDLLGTSRFGKQVASDRSASDSAPEAIRAHHR
jgi:PAS domain S-box-containing protein